MSKKGFSIRLDKETIKRTDATGEVQRGTYRSAEGRVAP
jgi:hypothetical protein